MDGEGCMGWDSTCLHVLYDTDTHVSFWHFLDRRYGCERIFFAFLGISMSGLRVSGLNALS